MPHPILTLLARKREPLSSIHASRSRSLPCFALTLRLGATSPEIRVLQTPIAHLLYLATLVSIAWSELISRSSLNAGPKQVYKAYPTRDLVPGLLPPSAYCIPCCWPASALGVFAPISRSFDRNHLCKFKAERFLVRLAIVSCTDLPSIRY